MSVTIFLTLDMEGRTDFDPRKMNIVLTHIEGIRDCRKNIGTALLECQFDFRGDSTTVILPNDLRYMTIWGISDASLQIALEIQRHYGGDIHAFLADASAENVSLSEISSIAELRKRLQL